MKISLLTPRFKPSIGGIEILVYETAKFLASRQNLVKIYTSRLTGINEQRLSKVEIIEGIQVFRSSSFPLLPIKGGMVNIMPSMISNILKDKSDIYHSFGVGSFPSIMGHIKSKQKKPIVITPLLYSTTEGKIAQTIIDKFSINILESAEKIIAQTKSEKKYLEGLGVKKNKIEIIPLYANAERFAKYRISGKKFKEKYNLKEFVILYVGRIEIWQKGLDNLLKALSIICKDFQVTLVITGEDWGSKDKLKKMSRELGISENVKFFDPKDEVFLGEAYHGSDVLVLPSNFEPFGTVLLEAMCCGTPVIGTKVGGIVDVIKHNETGFLVPPKNSIELANSISKIFTDEQKKEKFIKNGIEDMKNYSVQILGEKYLKIYTNILENK